MDNKEKKRLYMKEYIKEYYKKNKDKINKRTVDWRRKHPEYYEKNKDKILGYNKKWQTKNKKRFIELCCESRRRRVERLRAEGCTNAWAVINGAKPKYKKGE